MTFRFVLAAAAALCAQRSVQAQPLNDTCAGAIAVVLTGSPPSAMVVGTNEGATSTGDGPAGACVGPTRAVWFKTTPVISGTYQVDLCGTAFDTVLSVLTTPDCLSFVERACNDDSSSQPPACGGNIRASKISSVALNAGTTYYIRAGSFDAGAGVGPIVLNVTFLAATGSCCYGRCCAVLTQAACVGGIWTSGRVCNASTCSAPVVNDECAGAIGLSVGVAAVGGNCGATLSANEPAPTCQGLFGATVWYSVVPANTGLFNVGTCGGNFDSVLSMFTSADCASFNPIACNDDGCTGTEPGVIPGTSGTPLESLIQAVQLNAGQVYLIQVAGFNGATGVFPLLVSPNTVAGACCNATTGACAVSLTGAPGCAGGTTFLGGVCAPNPCAQQAGVCCTPDGSCAVLTGAACTTARGYFQGPSGTCAPGPACPVSVGACCNATTGVCTYLVTTATCSGGVFTPGGLCSPNTCPQPGRCCVGNCCSVTLQAACAGAWGPANSSCTVGACGTPGNDTCSGATPVTLGINLGSNCGSSTSFSIIPANQCGTFSGSGGENDVWHTFTPAQSANYTFDTCGTPGFDTTLALYNSCPADGVVPPRACNDDTAGACAVSTLRSEIANQLLVAGQAYVVRVAAYVGTPGQGAYTLNITQGAAAGACCTGTTCAIALGSTCPTANYKGNFSACGPNTCDPLGACCAANGTCSQVAQSTCSPSNFTIGVTCAAANCPQVAGACCCGASCTITAPTGCVGINRLFSGAAVCSPYNASIPCCRGDYNKQAGVSVQDIFDFLAGYFGNDPCSDSNDSGGVPSVQDIFDFLAAYFGGC